MRLIIHALKWFVIVGVILVGGFIVFALTGYDTKFEAPYPAITASPDSAVIARGKYLVYGPAHCAHCHSPTSEFNRVEAGEEVPLSGGFNFVLPIGTVFTPNITTDVETGIGSFTDGEIARAMRYGVKKDGGALMDFMPFYDLSDEDLTAVISYLRTTEPIDNKRPENTWNLMGKAIWAIGGIVPAGDGDVPVAPGMDSTVLYGEYLAKSVANCMGCHTNRDLQTGGWIGPYYAGGFPMEMIDENGEIDKTRHVISPNLTQDPETGRMASWSREDFINRFRTGRIIEGSPMPWGPFSKMSDLELIALYKFLKTLEPINSSTPVGVQDGPAPGY